MAYPNDTSYDPYPLGAPMNDPDPVMTELELICSYPDEPGKFASPPFYAGVSGPFQVYVPTITKIQDVLIDLADIYGADVKLSYLTGVIPSYYEEEKTVYFPAACGQQWKADEVSSDPLTSSRWDGVTGWDSATYQVGACLVVLRDPEGEFWPQYRNWQVPAPFGTLTYTPGTCADWAWTNPSDSTKTLHIKTPHTGGAHPLADCRQFRYGFTVYQYVPSTLRPPSIVPHVSLLLGGLLCCLTSAAVWPGKGKSYE